MGAHGRLGCFRPLKKLKKKNNVDKEGPPPPCPPARPSARAEGPGGAAPREEEKESVHIYIVIYIYPYIYNPSGALVDLYARLPGDSAAQPSRPPGRLPDPSAHTILPLNPPDP